MLWLKALHIMAVIAWFAGLFYLPRLFVYHADAPVGSQLSETFKVMEYRLLTAIMTPAMLVVWITGPMLAYMMGAFSEPWLHIKLLLVFLLSGFQGALSRWQREFAADNNTHPARFYRIANEVPTLFLIAIVLLVVLKPF
ncbi:Protoporphyrinogen IX oxidase [Hyphomicrobium sulfonivorans]|uniref:Protoporphyrinogen IX oxidase n=1 Tax=Hyphomicrobium sulfonivorans TaxID=121290 RepID=A0A109BCQ8_HYPSL|nr:protoporphyrinogen oxidase HemJ [Hyphomicrobium sulfonivorans]KWT66371.1 Protoporphyrinogen IX oxidase [Hyphomicrobium sulfonivorans]